MGHKKICLRIYYYSISSDCLQILNCKVNFHQEFQIELFSKKLYANNGRHFKIVTVSIIKKC